MKSYLKDTVVGDTCGGGLPRWTRLVLDSEELLEALRQDDVANLVQSVLETRYKDHPFFAQLLHDCRKSVMEAVANRLATVIPKTSLAVLMRLEDVEDMKLLADRMQKSREFEVTPYWVGEAHAVFTEVKK